MIPLFPYHGEARICVCEGNMNLKGRYKKSDLNV